MRKYKLLYVIGDSISQGYCPHLVTLLMEAYVVLHAPGNSTSSANIATNLDDWLAGYDPDVVLFNCGLHDLKREPGAAGPPLDQYEANLRSIVARLAQLPSRPRLIWARTTPHLMEEYQGEGVSVNLSEDVIALNEVADAVMAASGVESLDLHGAVMANDPESLISAADLHHFEPQGYEFLAQTITDYLLEQ